MRVRESVQDVVQFRRIVFGSGQKGPQLKASVLKWLRFVKNKKNRKSCPFRFF
jgi:hypothetical protein